MSKTNKFISIVIIAAFFLNTLTPSATACWWKGTMVAHGSPEINGAPSTQAGNNTGKRNQASFAEPIYLHNGDFVYEFEDLNIPSRGLPLTIKHSYKSQSIYNNRFGCGWDLNLNQRIVALANGDAYYFDGTNMRLKFTYLNGENYMSPFETYDQLTQNTDGTWTLAKKHGEKYYFNQNGLITKIEDRNKNAITFSYNLSGKLPITGIPYYPNSPNPQPQIIAYDWQLTKITDTVGREISLTYDENGRLISITDFYGRVIKYQYDINGDLISITRPATPDFPQGTTIRFSYTNHKLATITDAKNQTYLTNFYNGQGMVDSQEYAANKVYITYNLEANQTEVKDAKGFRTVYTFNTNGNPIKKEEFSAGLRVGEPASYITTYEYNNFMELLNVTYPKGNSISYNYDYNGNLSEIRRKPNPETAPLPNDIVTNFTYEPRFNFIKTLKDPRGNITTYYYDYEEETLGDLNGDGVTSQANGNLVKITYPAVGGQTPEAKFTYNTYGQIVTVTDPNGNVTKYEYNSTGYLSKTTNAYGVLNLATEMTYDSVGNVKTLKDPKGNTTSFEYDSHNNLSKTISAAPFNYITTYKYDANDNLIQLDRETKDTQNPWQTTYYTYDLLDRLSTIKDELDNTTTFTYDANGNRNQIKDANLNTTNYNYDERNLLWTVTDALGNLTEYTYDENGNLKEIKDAKGNLTTYTYDDFDRLLKTTYANNSKEEYTYDASSNLVTKKDPKGQTISYTYDALNRLDLKTYPDAKTVDYTYDKGSRLTDMIDSTGTIHYAYDAANRITQVTYPGTKTVAYEYDLNSNRSKLVYPDSSYITYVYDQLNRLTAIKNQSGANIASYTYDSLSRRTQTNLANSTQAIYAYDAINRLTGLTNKTSATTISSFNYAYDNVGNRLTMTTASGTHNYSYDNIYQLKTVDYPAGYAFPDITFNYDDVGNRNSTVNGGTTNYTSNSLNQYTQVALANYTHDTNGSLTNDGTFAYAYDYENRLTSATKTGTNANYKYDPFGRRIEKTVNSATTKFLYDGDQIIAEYDGAGTLISKFIYGAGIDELVKGLSPQGTVPEWFYHYDGLGSVTNLTNSTGSTSETYNYDIFGKPKTTSSVGNRFLFTGREYDAETGLYYYRARYYSPTLGRFLQRDPVGYIADINLYRYCSNNPVNWIDPKGLDKLQTWLFGGIVIGSETGGFLLRLFKEVGGESFRFQWRFGGQLYHIADSLKWGFHFASENTHWYWNRMVIQQSGAWATVYYSLTGKLIGGLGSIGLVVASGWIGWETGSWISNLPVPNLVGASDWNVTFGNAFVPSFSKPTEAQNKNIFKNRGN